MQNIILNTKLSIDDMANRYHSDVVDGVDGEAWAKSSRLAGIGFVLGEVIKELDGLLDEDEEDELYNKTVVEILRSWAGGLGMGEMGLAQQAMELLDAIDGK